MVNRIFSFLHKEISGVHSAAYLLGIFAFLSQIIALFRDRMLAHSFGAGQTLDLYYAAFRVPDFIFSSVASLVSISVLIPFLNERMFGDDAKDQQGAKEFMNMVFTVFLGVVLVASAVAYFLMPYLAKIIIPSISDPETIDRFVSLSRILLLQPIALGLSNLLGSITQATKRFFLYAISPVLYNLAIIFGIVFLYPILGLKGIVFGVVIGSIFHFAIQLPYISSLNFLPTFAKKIDFNLIKKVAFISLPRTLTLSLNSLELIFITSYASYMAVGSISIFNFSLNLQSVPFAIIGVSYTLAAFPTLSKLYAAGEKEKFINHITVASRHIIFWSLPVMALFIVLRAQIVRVILGSGEFNWDNTRLTAACLSLFVISLVAQSLELLFIRGYYAGGNTKKPLVINVISSLLTISLPFFLIDIFNKSIFFKDFIESLFKVEGIAGSSVLMLPLGYSIGTIINMIVLWIAFTRDFQNSFDSLRRVFVQAGSASVIMGFVSYQWLAVFSQAFDLTTLIGIFLQGFLSGLMGILSGILVLKLLKNKEIDEVAKIFHRKIWKEKVLVLEQDKLE